VVSIDAREDMKLLPTVLESLRQDDSGTGAGDVSIEPTSAGPSEGGPRLGSIQWTAALSATLKGMISSSLPQKGTPPASPQQSEVPAVQPSPSSSPFASLASALKRTFQGSSSEHQLAMEAPQGTPGAGVGLMVPWSCSEVKMMLQVEIY